MKTFMTAFLKAVIPILLFSYSVTSYGCYCGEYFPSRIDKEWFTYNASTNTFTDFGAYPNGSGGAHYQYSGQTAYYEMAAGCYNPTDYMYVLGGTLVGRITDAYGRYFIQIQWGSAGTGSIVYGVTGCPTSVPTVIINPPNLGNIVEASTGYSSGLMTGSIPYPASVNSGDIVYYRMSTKTYLGTASLQVTNGILLNTYTDNNGYKVFQVQWGATGDGKLLVTSTVVNSALVPTAQTISVTAPVLTFDGTDDRITSPHISAYNTSSNAFSIEAWIKVDSDLSHEATIFSKRSTTSEGIWFGINEDGSLAVKATTYTQTDDGFDLRDGQWHHVLVTRTGRKFLFYVDADDYDAEGRLASSSTVIASTHDVWIGDDEADVSNNSFKGSIKGLRFWNVERTYDDIPTVWKTNLNQYTTGLIGFWDMNELSGQTQTDRSINANNAVMGSGSSSDSNDPAINSGAPFYMNALIFDGVDDRVTIANNAAFNFGTGAFTIEAWISLDAGYLERTIVSKRSGASDANGIWFGTSSSGVLTLKLGTNTYTSTSGDLRGTGWRHVSVTRSGTTISFYVNEGVEIKTKGGATESSATNITNTSDLWLGNDRVSLTAFQGMLDEVRVWNSPRNISDIQGNYKSPNVSGTKGFWRFNEMAGQLDKDVAGLNNAYLGGTSSVETTDPLRIGVSPLFTGQRRANINAVQEDVISSSGQALAYPNPFTKSFRIILKDIDPESEEEVRISIFDVNGTKVHSETYPANDVEIVQALVPGIYQVTYDSGSSKGSLRVVRQ